MLVYYKEPLGILHINKYRIYGRKWHRSPIDLPYDIYKSYKELLVDATYRSGYLKERFGCQVSEIAFTVKELRSLPLNTLRKLASELGLLKRRGPRRDLKSHGVPATQKEIAKVIIEAIQNVA